MTDDIVARLRKDAPAFGMEYYDPTYDTRHEAADEIERLRAALKKMQRGRDRYRQAWEAEKARSALQQKEI